MQMSSFPKRKPTWLKNAEAAELLGVDVRTIKRWMKCPVKRKALGVVVHGTQCRIPRPDNLDNWASQVRRLLRLPPGWNCALRACARKNSRYWLESCRLWLAAYMKVLARDCITQEDKERICLLRQAAFKIFAPLPRPEMEVDKLKAQFPARLSECGLSEQEVQAIMQYWPDEESFKEVRAAYTLDELEKIRRRLDYSQAVHDLEQSGKKPTAKNIAPLLHKDLMAHINDTNATREQLPGIVVQNPTPEEMRRITLASVCDHQIARKKRPLVTLVFRQPQDGLARRTIQKRHPQKKYPQKTIVAGVYQIRGSIPGADEKPQTGRTPIRKPDYDAPSLPDGG